MTSKTQLQAALKKPYDRILFGKDVLKPVFGASFTLGSQAVAAAVQPTETERKVIQSVNIYGGLQLDDGTEVTCYEIVLQPSVRIERSKVAIQQYVRKLLISGQGALVNFITPKDVGTWRLTLVAKNSELTDEGVTEKTTDAKRYTYLLGPAQSGNTASKRLAELAIKSVKGITGKDLVETFSVAVLTKEFYNDLFQWYQWALSEEIGITFPKNTETAADDREKLEEQIIRLITRLLFVWFIKQKDLVPDYLFQIPQLKKVLKTFNPESTTIGNYYNAVLQNLFFATLNKPIKERAFARENNNRDIKTLYRYDEMFSISEKEILSLFKPIPFLNGGLFECLDKEDLQGNKYFLDGFSRNATQSKGHFRHRAFIPNCVFFDEAKGIFPLLERYNFTVEENAPEDVQVALDPELLGNVFENLLGAFNSETKESARKQSGSFYTPREIVNYMVSESLIAYLCQGCPAVEADTIRSLIEDTELPKPLLNNAVQCQDISNKLRAVKILDPACGSGAFPMGILKKMVEVLDKLDLSNTKTIYEQKLHLIEKCIYGVDIQTIAAQISKLRFFISLIVDQEKDETKDNYGVIPLPNLETKFVAANTLLSVGSENDSLLKMDDLELVDMKTQLWKIREAHFYAKNIGEKKKLREADEILRNKIQQILTENAVKPNEQQIELATTRIEQLIAERRQYEKEKWVEETSVPVQATMFDNPIQVQQTLFRVDVNKRERERVDKALATAQATINRENSKMVRAGFEKEVELLAHWDPYDQNKTSEFFDAEWMFLLANDFDIVIGNPPYLRIQGIREANPKLADELIKNYKSATGSFDLYVTFVEKSLKLIKETGIVNFIMPTKWTNAAFGKGLRELVSSKKAARKIIDFGAYQVFTASTYTGIQFFKVNSKELHYHKLDRDLTSNQQLSDYLNSLSPALANSVPMSKLSKENWVLTKGSVAGIIDKINLQPRRVSDVFDKIFQGLATSKDDVYFLYRCIDLGETVQGFSKQLDKDLLIEKGFVKPLLKGEDVHRYEHIQSDRFVVFPYKLQDGKAELYSEKEISEKFPLAYQYLKECESILRDRENGRFNIDGVWFQFGRKQGILFAEQEKLIAPEISLGGNFTFDENGEFYSTTTIYGYLKKEGVKESYKTLLAVMNSKLLWWYLVHTGTVLANGYFRFKPNYIKPFPLPEFPIEKADALEKIVNGIIQARRADLSANSIMAESEIDKIIFELYNLDKEEIEIINSL